MTSTDGFDRLVEAWLTSSASAAPDGFHDEVMDRAHRVRQRARWVARLRTNTAFSRGRPERAVGVVRLAPYVGLLVVIALLVAVVAVVVGSFQRRVPPPFGPAANGLLLYERASDIYVADPTGHNEQLIAGGVTGQSAPSWSHDGRQFAYLRLVTHRDLGSGVVAADAHGQSSHLVTTPSIATPEEFDWSPDGSMLAVIHWLEGRRAISVVAADGSLRGQTLDLGDVEPFDFVAWRPPDGAEVIFLGHPAGRTDERAVYAVRPDGGGLRRLAWDGDQGDATRPVPGRISFQDPSVSADGSTLALWDWEPGVVAGRDGSIHVIDLASGRDQRMTFDPTSSTELLPVLSPDGSKVVFERQDSDGLAQVKIASVDGRAPAVGLGPVFSFTLTHGFVVSPDGNMLILVVEGRAPLRIDIASGAVTPMDQAFNSPPSWQRLAP